MRDLRTLITRLATESDGQDLIEYALLASFIGLAAASATGIVGLAIDGWYTATGGTIATWTTTP